MQLSDILTCDHIVTDSTATSKKRALEQLSSLMASGDSNLDPLTIFDSLVARERLGGTGLGHGVALPHGRISGNRKTVAAFLRLNHGIDFDAVDQQPVDLLFGLLVPEESTQEHLDLLAELAERLSQAEFRRSLREAIPTDQLCALLTGSQSG